MLKGRGSRLCVDLKIVPLVQAGIQGVKFRLLTNIDAIEWGFGPFTRYLSPATVTGYIHRSALSVKPLSHTLVVCSSRHV